MASVWLMAPANRLGGRTREDVLMAERAPKSPGLLSAGAPAPGAPGIAPSHGT